MGLLEKNEKHFKEIKFHFYPTFVFCFWFLKEGSLSCISFRPHKTWIHFGAANICLWVWCEGEPLSPPGPEDALSQEAGLGRGLVDSATVHIFPVAQEDLLEQLDSFARLLRLSELPEGRR